MDIFDETIINLWLAFKLQKVAYIMVGGFAVNLHGFSRTTGDVDIYLKDTLENRKQLRAALQQEAIGDFETIETMVFIPGWTSIMLDNGIDLDIPTSPKVVNAPFDECLQMASIAQIHGLEIPFLHLNHLIENKLAVNSAKDQIGVLELQRIK